MTLNFFVGRGSSGKPVFEELPVSEIDESKYTLMASPGLVLGLARGDEILFHPESGLFDVLRRGGNVAIQVYVEQGMRRALDDLSNDMVRHLDATLDGLSEKQAVFSVSVSKGFSQVEDVLNRFVASSPGAEWYYGNVYANDGVTPLNWWLNG